MEVLNDLLDYKGLKIYQNTEMFSFSLDSVLLANFVKLKKETKKILDIGTGNAPIPLILSTKTKSEIYGVEIQEQVCDLAYRSVKYNELDKQIKIINNDIMSQVDIWQNEMFDIITCNPPFFPVTENVKLCDSKWKQIARHELYLDVDKIISVSRKLLKNNGSLYIVHRPERLSYILDIMRKGNIEPKRIQFVHPKENMSANIVLIEGIKMGKLGIEVEYPIISHNNDGTYTEEIKKIFR